MSRTESGHLSRRQFLHTTVGVVGAGVAGRSLWAAETTPRKPLLPAGVLGRTRYPATLVSFGAILISERQGTRVLKAAIDAGINLVHTSATYVRGRSIAAIGELFKADRTYREKVLLCLKSFTPDKDAELDGMLATLGTDHTDVLLSTMDEPNPTRLETIQKAQERLRKAGKIRYTGFVCHGDMNGVCEMVLDKAPKFFDAALLSTIMVPAPAGKAQKATAKSEQFIRNLRALRQNGVGVLSMKSGAREALTRGPQVFQAHVKAILEAGADTVLTSISTVDQVEMVRKLDLRSPASSPAERQTAAEFHESRAGACLMCGDCRKACPRGVPVNDLMRIRMYRDEYGWLDHARDEFALLGPHVRDLVAGCGDCTACARACPVGLAGAGAVRRIVEAVA